MQAVQVHSYLSLGAPFDSVAVLSGIHPSNGLSWKAVIMSWPRSCAGNDAAVADYKLIKELEITYKVIMLLSRTGGNLIQENLSGRALPDLKASCQRESSSSTCEKSKFGKTRIREVP